MSSTNKRHSFGKVFHRRTPSTATDEPAAAQYPSTSSSTQHPSDSSPPTRSADNRGGRDPSRRSLGDYVRSRSRSLSRAKNYYKKDSSIDPRSAAHTRPVITNSPPRDQGPPQIPPFENISATGTSELVLQATGPSVPPRASSLYPLPDARYDSDGGVVRKAAPLVPAQDPYSEAVADWNIVRHKESRGGGMDSSVSETSGLRGTRYNPPGPLTHKPDVGNLRTSVEASRDDATHYQAVRRKSVPDRHPVTRSSLDKPLPGMPRGKELDRRDARIPDVSGKSDNGMGNGVNGQREYAIENSDHPIDLTGVLDMTNSEEVHEYVTWAPAVTKETRIVNTHEIVQQAITREIHNHHVYHRVLPIVDIEVLPPRHFVPTEGGGYKEISEAEVPGGTDSARLQQLISDAVSKMLPANKAPLGPRQFTARKFEGIDGNYTEYTTPEGVKRTEQWWVHPPTLETGGQDSGQTQPFHLGSENPDDDGIRNSEGSAPNFSRKTPTGRAPTNVQSNGFQRQPQPASTHTVLPIRTRHG